MKPETDAQLRTLEAIRTVVAREGRGATLREITAESGASQSTAWKHIKNLAAQGLVRRGTRGVLPCASGEDRHNQGWLAACAHIRSEATRVMEERHVSPQTSQAILQVIECAEEGVKP